MSRVLVTGGAGFIGHHLVGRLVARGDEVVVLDNLSRGRRDRPELAKARVIVGDVRDIEACMEAVAGCHVVVHLAAQSRVMGAESDPDDTFTTNVAGTWTMARSAAAAGVRQFVFASSREVYGQQANIPVPEERRFDAKNLYGASKVAAETMLAALPGPAPAVSILRFTNVIGSGDTGRVLPLWLTAARTGEPLTLFGGEQVLDFVPVDTAVDAIVAACGRDEPLSPTNVGSGVATTLRALAARVVEAARSPSRIVFAPAREVEVEQFVADVSRLRQVLGITPPADPLAVIPRLLATP